MVPDSATDWLVEPIPFSVRVILPDKFPPDVGENATSKRHCPPGERRVPMAQSVPPEGCVTKFAGKESLEILSCWFPASVTVSVCVGLVVFTTAKKKRDAGCVRLILTNPVFGSTTY